MITLTEFWNSKGKKHMAIHCNTRKKAHKLLKAFDKLGQKWTSGCSYLKRDNYDDEGDKICYSNNGFYCDYGYYKNNNYIIYEFDEVDLEN